LFTIEAMVIDAAVGQSV